MAYVWHYLPVRLDRKDPNTLVKYLSVEAQHLPQENRSLMKQAERFRHVATHFRCLQSIKSFLNTPNKAQGAHDYRALNTPIWEDFHDSRGYPSIPKQR